MNRINENLLEVIPDDSNKPYDMMEIIMSVVDNGDFLEIQEHFAKNIIIGFGRMNGARGHNSKSAQVFRRRSGCKFIG